MARIGVRRRSQRGASGLAGSVFVALAFFAAGLVRAGGTFESPEGPFQHRKHAALKLKCGSCHATADKEERAGFPAVAQCKTCHTQIADRKIPSGRVYRVADFVFFSHAPHVTGKVECSGCHGDVNQYETLKVERPLTMVACVSCHKEQKATLVCNACHELGQ